MRMEDIDKAAAQAGRIRKADQMLAKISEGPVRITVGPVNDQLEIILTARIQALLKRHALDAVEAERTDATGKLAALGVEIQP